MIIDLDFYLYILNKEIAENLRERLHFTLSFTIGLRNYFVVVGYKSGLLVHELQKTSSCG